MITVSDMDAYLIELGVKHKKDRLNLLEAYRRLNFIHVRGNDPAFAGLGLISQYKGEFFKPSFPPPIPRVINWWTLTDKGKAILDQLEEKFPVPTTYEERASLNTALFNWQ